MRHGFAAVRFFLAFGLMIFRLESPTAQSSGSAVAGRLTGGAGRSAANVVVYLTPEGGEAPAPAEKRQHLVIHQRQIRFQPDFVAVPAGSTVDFINDDDVDHNVFSFSPTKTFDLGLYPSNVIKSITFDRPGPVLIFCSIHESMNGLIFVVPTPFFSVSDAAGRFRIGNVPKGRYLLQTWSSRLPSAESEIVVSDPPGDVIANFDLFNSAAAGGKHE